MATAIVAVTINGADYYLTAIPLRPFRTDYKLMKPSGIYSHGLGISGASMIAVGVAMYMTRKRIRLLWNMGKLSRWLEFHIFLCVLGPIFVMYHTTFKAGGVAAISLWTMLSVAASGIVGRFLYVQIPRNILGVELSRGQVAEEIERLGKKLGSSQLGSQIVKTMDAAYALSQAPTNSAKSMGFFFGVRRIRRRLRGTVREMIAQGQQDPQHGRELSQAAAMRATLIQKSLVLVEVEKLFHFWHVVHVPFTVIMFITLTAHVTVTLLLGYNWVF